MNRIYKYPVPLEERPTIRIPAQSHLLTIQAQDDHLYAWAEVDPGKPESDLGLVIVGTGHPVPDDAVLYITTVQLGGYVWHFYTRGEADV